MVIDSNVVDMEYTYGINISQYLGSCLYVIYRMLIIQCIREC